MAKYITKLGWEGEVYDIRDKAAHEKIDNLDLSNIDLTGYATKDELTEAIDGLEIPEVDLSNYYNKTEIDTKFENVDTECAPQFGLVKAGQTIPSDENKMFFIFEDTHDGATYITITLNGVDGYRMVEVHNITSGENDGDLIINGQGGTMTLHIYAHKGDTVICGYTAQDEGGYYIDGKIDETLRCVIPIQTEVTINTSNSTSWTVTNAEVEMKIMMNCPSNTSFWGGIKNQTTGQMLEGCGPYSGGLKTISVKPTDEIRAGSSNDDYDGGLSDTNYVVVPVRTDGKITPVNYDSNTNTWSVGTPYEAGEATVE